MHWLQSERLTQRITNRIHLRVSLSHLKAMLVRRLGLDAALSDLPLPARLYLLCIWIISAVLLVWSIRGFTWSLQRLSVVLLFGALFYGLDLFPIVLRPGGVEVTLSVSAGIAAVMLLSPSSASLVVFVGTSLAEIRFTRPWYKKAFNVGQLIIVYTTLAWIFQHIATSDPLVQLSVRNVAAVVAVWATHYLLNDTLVTVAISLAMGLSPFTVWRIDFQEVVYHRIFTAPLGTLLAVLIRQQPLAVILILPPMYMMHRAIELTSDLRQQTTNALMAFADSIDTRDPSTYQHSQRVGELAKAIAEQMGLPPDESDVIHLSARVHDLGKVGIPDALLLKPGELSDEEYDAVKEHTVMGAQIVENFPLFGAGHDIIKHHHEHYDGQGYPEQLAGEEIPLGARIIAVADAYDAITSDRPYRAGLSRDVALQWLVREKGKQFDPEVVDAFLEVMEVDPSALVPEDEDLKSPATLTPSGEERISVSTCSH